MKLLIYHEGNSCQYSQIGVGFVETSGICDSVREEFLGFAVLEQMTASAIADQILSRCNKFGLDMTKLLGQGYDGCSVMAGEEEGRVQAKIRKLYPKADFVHCASHGLNRVVNDLNSVAPVRNALIVP